MKALGVLLIVGFAALAMSSAASPPPNLREIAHRSELAKKHLVVAPEPAYPLNARHRGIEGSGLFRISFDSHTGVARSVEVVLTTGSSELDQAAIAGFRHWRCRPGTLTSVVFPITFTMHRKR